jgi:hypothetical protein
VPLFANLNDHFFLPFSRRNRWFYEECLIRLYVRFYKDAPRYPRDSEVIADIYETLKSRPDLWSEEEGLEDLPELQVRGRRRAGRRSSGAGDSDLADAVRARAVRHYEYLIATGWLEEERFGIVKTVDMSPGALSMMETLHRIREGFSLQFSGTLVQLNLALKGIAEDPAVNALSLNQVRQNLESFVRHLRAIISDLKRIRAEMMEGEGQKARLKVFFDGFVKRLLLKDFAALHTTNHPYRYKNEILVAVRRLSADGHVVRLVAKTYAEHAEPELMGRGSDWEVEKQNALDEAAYRVVGDLNALVEILGHIDQMFERIRAFQSQLEERLRNMLRYKSRGRRDYAKRIDGAIDRLVAALAASPEIVHQPLVDGYLDSSERLFGEALHSAPRREKVPLGVAAVHVSEPDPVDLFQRDLKNAYLRRLRPSPAVVADFVDRVMGHDSALEAAQIPMNSIDDFLAFDALLLMSRRGKVPGEVASRFKIEASLEHQRVRSEYVECEPFRIVRLAEAANG